MNKEEIMGIDSQESPVNSGTMLMAQKVDQLERKLYATPDSILMDEQLRRARGHVEYLKCYSAQWKWVPTNYYDLSLAKRANILGAPSTKHLCKAMLMENKSYQLGFSETGEGIYDSSYSQFYLVVVQYNAVISNSKLNAEIRKLRPADKNRAPPNAFNFSVAKEADNDRLTGYLHNSVTPFGMAKSEAVPIVLASKLVNDCSSHPFLWMGGGHVQLKLGMSVSEFVTATNAIVADVSEPRLDAEESQD